MKFIFIIFILLLSSNTYSETRIYSFTRTETISDDDNSLEGNISFSIQGKKEFVSLEYAGNHKFNIWDDIKYDTQIPLNLGFEIYDVRRSSEPTGFSIFGHHINISEFKPGYKTRNIETERRHPYFRDYSWNFYLEYIKNEKIQINGKIYDAAYLTVKGDRPTGGMNCRTGQPGVVKIHSWYNLKDSKLLKQIFSKYLCKPFEYNLLEKDTYILQ